MKIKEILSEKMLKAARRFFGGTTALLAASVISALILSGCSLSPAGWGDISGTDPDADIAGSSQSGESGCKVILACGFAQYDWIRNILGENPADIQLLRLNEGGTDLHSYQPTVADMVKISDCDLLIYTGGESEFWIDDAAVSSQKSDSSCLSLMEIFEGPELLCKNYEEAYTDHDHDHEHEHEDEHDHEGEADEHLWLSLKMAPRFIEEITEAICVLDPSNRSYYEKNAMSYMDRIKALDAKYEEAASAARRNGTDFLLIADRFPFTYLVLDYDLNYLAAFPGCSAETEASFATILTLSEALDEHRPAAVIVLKKSGTELAQTVIKNSNDRDAEILTLDDMQSVTAADVKGGAEYLSIMEENLKILTAALGAQKGA